MKGMFGMMNAARLGVGVQGISVAESQCRMRLPTRLSAVSAMR